MVATCPHLPAQAPASVPPPPKPPSSARLVLAPAHWDWIDGNYSWTQAAWVPPPHPKAATSGRIWQDGSWSASGIACSWEPGRFLF